MPEHEPTAMSCSSKSHASKRSELSVDDIGVTEEVEEEVQCPKDDAMSIANFRATTISEDEENGTPEPRPRTTISRTTSVTPDAVIVPRRNRRGLLSHLTLIPEVECAYHYANRTKWIITSIVAFCGIVGPMGSAIVLPVLGGIAKDFDASPVIANMSVAVYMLAMGIFPLWWSSFSETGGRRTVYIVSFVLSLVFAVLSAVATNISMLVAVRTFSGGAAASVQVLGAGTIADIWEVKERGRALGLFYLGPLCGPLLAPIIGGALGQGFGWRSTQWFLVIYGAITLVLIIFGLPETLPPENNKPRSATTLPQHYPPTTAPVQEKDSSNASPQTLTRISTRASVAQNTKSLLVSTHRIFIEPLLVLTWLRYPPVALTVYYASITFGSLYFLNISLQWTFSAAPYSFSTFILGLLYIPGSLGYMVASLTGGQWIDRIMAREARKAQRYDSHGKLIYRPEDRMKENAWIAGAMWPLALIWYGWSAQYGVHWICPMIANFFFGVGSMLVFALVTTMLTEMMPRRASAGVAINNFCRSLFCFVGAVAADPVIQAIGNGWLMVILGGVGLVSGAGVILAMGRWGSVWRDKMVEVLG
ncbi:MFS general substrate transporter [Westerdykella ornata]|uniref:MFS general substrate transporter n=1 Tax=Westerdykella ornata TaxID=318751 RepID=A0A6A6J5B6_WESOR|nr:MFS general substrate transporter [Westerdykella ornata]KAF2271771.1 MFS general substrate transporter [Westerdykella ornata]